LLRAVRGGINRASMYARYAWGGIDRANWYARCARGQGFVGRVDRRHVCRGGGWHVFVPVCLLVGIIYFMRAGSFKFAYLTS
jgi:hypothetical protein